MTTNKENSLKFLRLSTELAQFMRVLPQRFGVLHKLGGDGVVFEGFDGGGIQRCFAA